MSGGDHVARAVEKLKAEARALIEAATDLEQRARELRGQAAVIHARADGILEGAAAVAGPNETQSLTAENHGVSSNVMLPTAKNALNKTKAENRTPELLSVLSAGWTVRSLAEVLTGSGEPISHSQLGRYLRRETEMPERIRRAIRTVAKVKI